MKQTNSAFLPNGQWSHGHFNALCWSRGVDRAVIDFVRHNMGDSAALAALRAMPVTGGVAATRSVPTSVVLAVDPSWSTPEPSVVLTAPPAERESV